MVVEDVTLPPGATVQSDALPVIGDVIERIGLGWAQFRVILLGGDVWLADGSELLLIGTVTRAVSKEWNLHAWQRGMVVSIVFVGILLGNAVSGPMGDRLGRRLPILLSYAGIVLFSVLSSMTQAFYQLAAIRLLVGMSFGIGQPAYTAMCTEVTPAYWRILTNSASQGLFVFGELYSVSLVWYDDPEMRNLDWRWLLLMGAIPSLVCGTLATLFLHQSPSYLAVNGEYDAAVKVLESMRDDNRAGDFSVEFRAIPARRASTPMQAMIEPLGVIYSPRLVFSTVVVIYSCFTLNVLFYGCLYAFPQVVTDVDMGSSPAVALLMGACWEFPGIALACVCGMFWPRKPVIIGYLIFSSAALVAFTVGAEAHTHDKTGAGHDVHHYADYFLHLGYIGIKASAIVGFVAVYQYATEIYPTVARTTGTSACIAGGRVGGMVAPLVYEELLEQTGNFSTFFYTVATLCVINLVFVVFLPLETFGKALQDTDEGETWPLIGSAH